MSCAHATCPEAGDWRSPRRRGIWRTISVRYLPRISVAGIILLAAGAPAAQAASLAHPSSASCPAKGNVSFMFWGDKGEFNEQTLVIKQAEAACPGLHVTPVWDQGNYDNDLATKIG